MSEESYESRFDARMIGTLKGLDDDAYKNFVVHLLSNIGMKVTAAAMIDAVAFVEGEREGGKYLVMASRRPEHASADGVMVVKDKALLERRSPVLILTSEGDDDTRRAAERFEVSLADRGKLLQLIKKYDLMSPLLKEIDRKILEKDGTRYLPSIGRFDSYFQAGEDALKHERYKDAIEELGKALELKPEHDLSWRMKASAHLAIGENDEALASMQHALDSRSHDPNSWFIFGTILHQLGRFEEEIDAYDTALRYEKRMYSALLNKAATLFQLGRKEEALNVYDELLRQYPKEPRLIENRGVILHSMGRNAEALASFESVHALDPSSIGAVVRIAETRSELGRVIEAVRSWQEAVSLDRRRADLWIGLAVAQRSAGLLDEAGRSFGVASTLDPSLAMAKDGKDTVLEAESIVSPEPPEAGLEQPLMERYLQSALVLHAIGESGKALRDLDRALAIDSSDHRVYRLQANILTEKGWLAEAIAALAEGIRHAPEKEALFLDFESISYRLGRYEDCLKLLDNVVDRPEATVRQALLQLELGRASSAQKSIANSGNDSMIEITRALASMKEKLFEEALERLRTLAGTEGPSPHVLNGLGVCLRFSGQLEEAESVLHQALQIEPMYADAWSNLGCVHYLRGSNEEAERCFQEALLRDHRPYYHLNLAMCRLGREDLDGADESASLALRLEESADALNLLGIIAERRKENARALEMYEAALRLAPVFRDAQLNRERVRALLKR
jgi:tetratricopeptide (TPR) repeat protein